MIRRFLITVTQTGQRVDVAQYWPNMDAVACVVREGTDQRAEIEGGIRFLAGEQAAESVDLNCGLTVARA